MDQSPDPSDQSSDAPLQRTGSSQSATLRTERQLLDIMDQAFAHYIDNDKSLRGFGPVPDVISTSSIKGNENETEKLPRTTLSPKSSSVSSIRSAPGEILTPGEVVAITNSESRITSAYPSISGEQQQQQQNHQETKPAAVESSHTPLQEIESFHCQFVGNLPLLSNSSFSTDPDKKITGTSETTGVLEVETTPDSCEETLKDDSKDDVDPPTEQVPSAPFPVDEVEKHEEAISPCVDSISKEKVAEEVESENKNSPLDLPLYEVTPEVHNKVDEQVAILAKKYLEFLEKEWRKRREFWLENNRHNPNAKSLYASYPTFRECAVAGKIKLQVPFDLPDVRGRRNPVLKDTPVLEIDEKRGKQRERGSRKSKLPKSDFKSNGKESRPEEDEWKDISKDKSSITETTNSITTTPEQHEGVEMQSSLHSLGTGVPSVSLQDVLATLMKSGSNHAAHKLDSQSEEDVNVTPLDLTAFLDECADIWEDLKQHQLEPAEQVLLQAFQRTDDNEEDHLKEEEKEQALPQAVEMNPEPIENKEESIVVEETTDENLNTPVVPVVVTSTSSQKSKASLVKQKKSGTTANSGTKPGVSRPNANQGLSNSSKLPSRVRAKSSERRSKPKGKLSGSGLKKKSKSKSNSTIVQFEASGIKAGANETIVNDLDGTEPIVEIYRGLQREDTLSNLKTQQSKDDDEIYAYVNGRRITCSSRSRKVRLDVCSMKLNTKQYYASNLRDLSTLPGSRVLPYLSHEDFINCRLVSRKWNSAVMSCKKFLSTTTFVVAQKPLGALAALESSGARWESIRCSVMPSINFTTSSYNGRFHSSNLRGGVLFSGQREPVTNTLTTVIFENFDIHRQQLVQWIQNCKRLSVVEVRNCNFLRSSISMNMDKTNKVMERIQVMRFRGMDIVKLGEALRFFLPATRRLQTLEIVQKRERKLKSPAFTARKGAEEEVASVLCPALKRNGKTLRNIHFELISTKNYHLQSRIVETLGTERFQLSTLVVRSFVQGSSTPCLKIDSYGSPKGMTSLLRSTLSHSKEMSVLDFPMLSVDFVCGEEGSRLLPCKLEKLAVQLEMPLQDFNTDVEFLYLRELELYGTTPLEDFQWSHVKQTMKGLTRLSVHCTGIRDSHLQSIILNLKSLQVLRIESAQDVTDFGITGMEQSWIERLRMYWPEKIDSCYEQFPRDKIRFVGKSMSSLEDLRSFVMKGSFNLSNVGILYGFNSRELTSLELSGSPVNASNSGLFILGFQCPRLQNLRMSVQHAKANQMGIRDLFESLTDRCRETFQVELLPHAGLPEESDARLPMITPTTH